MTMFTVTREWLDAHSKNGGWTRDQLVLIGVDWPPVRGWKERVIGMEIDAASKARFEEHLRRKDANAAPTLDMFK